MASSSTWTIGRRVGVGYGSLILILAVVGGLCYHRIGHIHASAEEMDSRAMPGLLLLGQAECEVMGNFINTTQHVMATAAADKASIDKMLTGKKPNFRLSTRNTRPSLMSRMNNRPMKL